MRSPVLDAGAADRERLARVALNQLFEPGDERVDGLTTGMTGYELFLALRNGVGPDDVKDARADIAPRLDALRPDHTLELADALGLRFVIPGDPEWPAQLDDLAGMPPIQGRTGVPFGLWVKGALPLDRIGRSVAIVGSRDATRYGIDTSAHLAHTVARNETTVVSGGAFGIDAAAHRGALAAPAPTVAVLACGADLAYPVAHERLLAAIAETGAVVSELPPGQRATRMRFLSRNRLIAALTTGTVVVEAALRSGALNTANWATALSRLLMGVPGPVTASQSEGVLEQIRAGRAMLVSRGEHVLELLAPMGEHLLEVRRAPETTRDQLSTRLRQILDAVPLSRAATGEEIAREAGVAFHGLGRAMLQLERHGLVERWPEGWRLAPGAALQ